MKEYFTIFVKETDNGETLKLLNTKLNEGFRLDDRIPVGRSTIITLFKYKEDSEEPSRLRLDNILASPTISPTISARNY